MAEKSACGGSWEAHRKELFSSDEIVASDDRVVIMGETIRDRNEQREVPSEKKNELLAPLGIKLAIVPLNNH